MSTKRCLFVLLLAVMLCAAWGDADDMTVITYQIITPDNTTISLETGVYRISGLENIGMAGVRTYSHQVPGQPGAVLEDMLADVTSITVTHAVTGADAAAVFGAINTISAGYRYNRTATLQPLRLRVTVGAKAADLYCYYGGMIVSKVDNVSALFGFTLNAYDPYWYATTETSTASWPSEYINENCLLGHIDSVYTAMSAGAVNDLRSIAVDSNDDLYVAPWASDDWQGVAGADEIALYDSSAGTWSALGTGMNGVVYKIIIGPNGDVYAGGSFALAGGVANTVKIAKWGGSAWSALGTGADDGSVLDLAIDTEGNLYAAGTFTGMGGVANTPGVAKWNGTAWTALGTGADDNAVYGLVTDQADNVYATGTFTGMGGVGATAYIAKWNGTAWTALGTGLNAYGQDMIIDQDGALYVTGNFTTANGVSCAYIAQWTGQTFTPLGSGLDARGYYMGVSPNNELYVSGTFTTAGGLPYAKTAIWNGATWKSTGIDWTDGVVYTFAWDSSDNLYYGFVASTGVVVPHAISVTNAGNEGFPPTLEISGPGTLALIRNEVTGKEIPANLYVNDGETITIDLGDPGEVPGGIAVTSDWTMRPNANNLLGKIPSPAQLASFALVPAPLATTGVNTISVFVTGQPVEANDNNTQLSRWAGITGIATTNTDDGRLYVSIVDDTGGFFHVDLYSDSARTALVGHTATYNAAGSQAIVADNTSGLGGTLYIDAATAVDVNIRVDYALVVVKHWNRYDSMFAAVS